jgi:hypothetical protein
MSVDRDSGGAPMKEEEQPMTTGIPKDKERDVYSAHIVSGRASRKGKGNGEDHRPRA